MRRCRREKEGIPHHQNRSFLMLSTDPSNYELPHHQITNSSNRDRHPRISFLLFSGYIISNYCIICNTEIFILNR